MKNNAHMRLREGRIHAGISDRQKFYKSNLRFYVKILTRVTVIHRHPPNPPDICISGSHISL